MNIRFAYFGTSHFSVVVLDELLKRGYTPSLIVTTPDKPQGRKLIMTPPPAKLWAEEHKLPVVQLSSLKDPAFIASLKKEPWDLFIVASYGKIIPTEVLEIPRGKTLNVHPSLLPKFRGASPIQSSILADEKETGVTIMRLDAEMDHGPIVAQKHHTVNEWPTAPELKDILGHEGGALLADVIPGWLDGSIREQEQDHSAATYTKKIEKQDGLVSLSDDPYLTFRKIQAYAEWPHAFFYMGKDGVKKRIIIKKARFEGGHLVIERIIPEGKQEMSYDDYMRSHS